jgi:hypothetical protein
MRSSESLAEEILDRIARNTRVIRLGGLVILLLSLANLFVLVASVIYLGNVTDSYDYTAAFLIASATLTFFTLTVLAIVESLRKRTDAYFQEVSDELQYSPNSAAHTSNPSQPSERLRKRLELQARVVLREFSVASDLPLMPGRLGVSLYALVALAILVGSVVVYISLQPDPSSFS